MKTIEKRFYVCEICGKSGQDENKVRSCQAGHALIDEKTEFAPVYQKGSVVPNWIRIKFSNGYEAQFILTDILSKGEQK